MLTFVGSNSANRVNGTGSDLNMTLPGGVATNDVVYVCGGGGSDANDNPGVSTADYIELADLYSNDTDDSNFSANRKVMGGTPDSSVDCLAPANFDGLAYCVHVWRGQDLTTPEDTATTTVTTLNTPVVDSPSITTVTRNAVVLSCGGGATTSGDGSVTAPSGYINAVVGFGEPNDGSTEFTAVMASKVVNVPGAENPAAWGTWTDPDNAASYCAVSIAIRPASDIFFPMYKKIPYTVRV